MSENSQYLVDHSTVDKNTAQAILFTNQAEKERLLAEYQALILADQRDTQAFALASDVKNRVWHFNDQVNQESCMVTYTHLARWYRMDPDKPVEIVFTSGGGEVWQGMALVDQMLALRAKGLWIQGTIRGTVASMASILIQACSWRVAGPSSTQLIHKLSAGVEGSLDQIEDVTKWLNIINEQVIDLYAGRCANADPATATKPFTKTQIKAGMNRKDWSLGPAEQLAGGLVDEIG